MTGRSPKIVMLGFRGFPNVQGGIEKHVESLAPLLVARGFTVVAIGRRPHLPDGERRQWRGVDIVPLWAPRRKSLETIAHTFIGVLEARRRGADLLHIHAIGPALWTPLARGLGLRVVVTHHGNDYDRSKWNGFAKTMLRLGERLGMRFAQGRIAVSAGVAGAMQSRYGRAVTFVPNGVAIEAVPTSTTALERFGLTPRRYVIAVSRLVPEKRQLDLIAAFGKLADPATTLVIVGSSDHPDAYVRDVESAAATTPNVVMTGFQTDTALAELFGHAALFVLPSSHEGMPIALLEALGYGLPVLASDIPANLELNLPPTDYFPLGDIDALATAIQRKLAAPLSAIEAVAQIERVRRDYAWDSVADRTAMVYRDVLADARGAPSLVSARSENRS